MYVKAAKNADYSRIYLETERSVSLWLFNDIAGGKKFPDFQRRERERVSKVSIEKYEEDFLHPRRRTSIYLTCAQNTYAKSIYHAKHVEA